MDQVLGAGPPGGGRGKRRQYAAGETQAYYGDAGAADPSFGGMGQMQQQQPQPQPQGQLFTPGLSGENQFAQQQQQPYYGAGPGGQGEPDYINGPQYTQQQPQGTVYSQTAPVDQLANQFGGMGIAGGQKPYSLQTLNLITTPPDPRELSKPPPEIRLPPNACLSPSPSAQADPSYQRCTLNAIPTTSNLLNKTKLPLALVITPYHSLKEGDPEVPLVTDTVIARCRRCRTYINPYVQFIDGGNRWVVILTAHE